MRESGILMPVFSLPSKFGIGCFSKEAFEFVDFLERSGQGYWQILPLGPTGFSNSPYQPSSAFAGNPYFISPETLIEEGLLTWEDVNGLFFGANEEQVDYGALYENRFLVLQKAYERFSEKTEDTKAYKTYQKKEAFWLEDYALFTALKEEQKGMPWYLWEKPLKYREPEAMKTAEKRLHQEIDLIKFRQFEFDRQWQKLRTYAAEKKVKIIGDLPFYLSLDSADVWAHPEVFQMDKHLEPKVVAGCPPDAFSGDGQLWGNPIYDWKALEKQDYEWWVRRMRRNYELFDVIRIDHFHGFCDYYAIPYGSENARNGTLQKGPGMKLFDVLKKEIGDLRIIADDLGNATKENVKLLEETGFPGMKVLQFAFTSWESCYVTHRHIQNCVVYTGTHDNTTARAWVEEISDGEREFTRNYLNSIHTDYGQLVWDFIREAYRSVAELCIVPLQDYLCKGREARINTPGVAEGNWQWRLKPDFLSEDLARSIRKLSETYSRLPK